MEKAKPTYPDDTTGRGKYKWNWGQCTPLPVQWRFGLSVGLRFPILLCRRNCTTTDLGVCGSAFMIMILCSEIQIHFYEICANKEDKIHNSVVVIIVMKMCNANMHATLLSNPKYLVTCPDVLFPVWGFAKCSSLCRTATMILLFPPPFYLSSNLMNNWIG